MLCRVRKTIAAHGMLDAGDAVLVALSGGADSVALLLALQELGYAVRAFHLHHGLRGAEADRDEAFVRDLCAKHGVPLCSERADVAALAAERGQSIEATARAIRYERLRALAQGDRVATAHTADDNTETMLFHLARGTGPKGLAGIPPVRQEFIRPLIQTERAEVEAYLAAHGQAFMTDSTNFSAMYTRNRIRHEVMPVLRTINPALNRATARLSAALRRDEAYFAQATAALLAQAETGDGWRIDVLAAAPEALRTRALHELLHRTGAADGKIAEKHIALFDELLRGGPAALDLPEVRARREQGVLLLARRTALPPISVKVPFDECLWSGVTRMSLRFSEKKEEFNNSFNTFCVDCGTISFETLTVRPPRADDRLHLAGAGGSRTLKRLLRDRRVPPALCASAAVLADEYGVIAAEFVGADISRDRGGKQNLIIHFEREASWHMI